MNTVTPERYRPLASVYDKKNLNFVTVNFVSVEGMCAKVVSQGMLETITSFTHRCIDFSAQFRRNICAFKIKATT